MTSGARDPAAGSDATFALYRRHLLIGWWGLLLFLTLGLALEAFHGLKLGWYLDVDVSVRRLMLTLAHTHGTLLALVNLAFAWAVSSHADWGGTSRTVASYCLGGATVLLPGGFFLGGIFIYSTDPGVGVLLVPLGGVLLLMGILLTARALTRLHPAASDDQ